MLSSGMTLFVDLLFGSAAIGFVHHTAAALRYVELNLPPVTITRLVLKLPGDVDQSIKSRRPLPVLRFVEYATAVPP